MAKSKEAIAEEAGKSAGTAAGLFETGTVPVKPDNMDPNEIIAQIREGDLVGVKVFLRGNGDPNTRNSMGWTLLHMACLEGQADIAEALLEAGASVNCCTTEMVTPLHLASAKGNKKTVEVLANKGAYINAQDKNGNTPLHEAAKGLHTQIVSFLIEKKGDKKRPNKKNHTFVDMVGQQMMTAVESDDSEVLVQWLDWGLSPDTSGNLSWSILHHAAARGQINIASILLERGGNPNALDSNRSTPLHAASFHGHSRIVELLLGRGASINAQDQMGNTALHSAISGGHPEIINMLLQNGCDTTIENKEGQVFTHLVNEYLIDAVEKCHVANVVALLKGKANPDSKNSAGFPILCSASFKGNVLIVDALLEAGANANLCTEDNLKTPLHYAAAIGNLFVLKLLLDKGASVTNKDRNGLTPLHEVAREGTEDVTTVLIGRGASLKAQDAEGNTPLHIAARWGQTAVVELLLEKGGPEDIRNNNGMLYSDLALMRAVRTQNADQVVSGLAWGGNHNTQDSKGWSLLHHAVYKGAKEVCSVLIESDADVNIKNNHGRTPLFLASYRGDLEIMDMLLKAGADPNIQDVDGRTPLHWAADEGSIATVELLLSRGAERNFKSKKGLLFSDLLLKHLYFAVRHNDEHSVESLLRAGADQSAEVYGTGVTAREEAKRRKYYPILKKMVSLAPSKPPPKPSKEEVVALEDVRKLFEDKDVDGESSDASSSECEDEESEDEDEEEGEEEKEEITTTDPNENAYWKMHNAHDVVSAKDLFRDEEKSFWEHWTEKPVPAKEIFKEKAWWENSSSSSNSDSGSCSSSSTSSDQSSSEESDEETAQTFEKAKQKWGKVIPAKDFFREDECWWRDAVEDLDKPKVISAKEFFKDETPWWEKNSSDEERELERSKKPVENEKPVPAKEFFKEETCWWEQGSSEEEEEDNDIIEEVKLKKEKDEKSEEDEVSVYEDLEESLTDDWETANDSIMSDTSTMYSLSEGDVKIMASDLFAEKPWWEDESKSDNSEGSSSAQDELSEDPSEESEATEIDADSSNTEKARYSFRRRIISSTEESDASTNIILEDNADNDSVGNVLDLETDDELLDSNVLGGLDNEWNRRNSSGSIDIKPNVQDFEGEILNRDGYLDDSNEFTNQPEAADNGIQDQEVTIDNKTTENDKELEAVQPENKEYHDHTKDKASDTESESSDSREESGESSDSDESISSKDSESEQKYLSNIPKYNTEVEELVTLDKCEDSAEENAGIGNLQIESSDASTKDNLKTESKQEILNVEDIETRELRNSNRNELQETGLPRLDGGEGKEEEEETSKSFCNNNETGNNSFLDKLEEAKNTNELQHPLGDPPLSSESEMLNNTQTKEKILEHEIVDLKHSEMEKGEDVDHSVKDKSPEADIEDLSSLPVENLKTLCNSVIDQLLEKKENHSVIDQLLEKKENHSNSSQRKSVEDEKVESRPTCNTKILESKQTTSLQTNNFVELNNAADGKESEATTSSNVNNLNLESQATTYPIFKPETEVKYSSHSENDNNLELQGTNTEIISPNNSCETANNNNNSLSNELTSSREVVSSSSDCKITRGDAILNLEDNSTHNNKNKRHQVQERNNTNIINSIQSEQSAIGISESMADANIINNSQSKQSEIGISETMAEARPPENTEYHEDAEKATAISAPVTHSHDETEIPDNAIAQTHSIRLKLGDFRPTNNKELINNKDLKGKGTKFTDEKLVTVKNPVLNKMDACLARLDASLAWLDAKMASDAVNDNESSKITEKDAYPSPTDRHSLAESILRFKKQMQTKPPCPEIKMTPDAFQIFRVKVRIPEEHTLKSFDNYHEKSRPKSEILMKESSSENALYDGHYNVPSTSGEHDSTGMQKYNSLAKLESIFPHDLHSSNQFLDKKKNGDTTTLLKPSHVRSNDNFRDLKTTTSSDNDKSKSLDLLSLLTDTLPSITASDTSKTSSPSFLRRHNSEEIFLKEPDDHYLNKGNSRSLNKVRPSAEVFHRNKYFPSSKTTIPSAERRYSAGEIHNRFSIAEETMPSCSTEKPIMRDVNRKTKPENLFINEEKISPFTDRRHSADELDERRSFCNTNDTEFVVKKPNKPVSHSVNNNSVSDSSIQKDSTTDSDNKTEPEILRPQSKDQIDASIQKDTTTDSDNKTEPEILRPQSKDQIDASIQKDTTTDSDNKTEPEILGPQSKEPEILRPQSKDQLDAHCKDELDTNLSNSSSESSDRNQATPNEGIGDKSEPSQSSCSNTDTNSRPISGNSEVLLMPDFEPTILPNKSNWRWSTFEPRTINEYDHIVSSFTNNPRSNALLPVLKKARSTNSVNDTTSMDEVGQGVASHTSSESRSGANQNVGSLFSTNRFEAKSNLRIKPPIPPRRNKDNRQSSASTEKSHHDQGFCPKPFVNDRYLSNLGQQQNNEREESSIPNTPQEKENISSVGPEQSLENASLDQMPKAPPRRASRRAEHVVTRSSSCSLC